MNEELQEQLNRADRLARDILILARNTLLVNFRFLDLALSQFTFRRNDTGSLATDGQFLLYDLRYVLLSYQQEKEIITRDYLHVVLHCVFRHMYVHTLVDQPCWDLACDIAVENMINELDLPAVTARRQQDQQAVIEELKQELNVLTAERIYRYYLDQHLSETRIIQIRKAFYGDDHSLWYLRKDEDSEGTEEGYASEGGLSDGGGEASRQQDATVSSDSETSGKPKDDESANGAGGTDHSEDPNSGAGGDTGGENGEEGSSDGGGSESDKGERQGEDGQSSPDQKNPEDDQNPGPKGSDPTDNDSPDQSDADDQPPQEDEQGEEEDGQTEKPQTMLDSDGKKAPEKHVDDEADNSASAMEQLWKDISETMQSDLENFSKQQGSRAGSLLQNLAAVNREKYDYTAFLKKFAVRGEIMKLDDAEFDYIFYTYGLHLFERMPLIEPLEYQEAKRIRDFVIAIDTSGSVSGEVVQTFIQKTYNILKETESFHNRMNLHIIQCDAEIQSDTKITTQEELDAYIAHLKIQGLGGTDFRPVFAYVDELIANHEFQNLRGLLYFTDGFGAFPARQPGYDTAFIFLDDNDNNPEVPAWAMKVLLHGDELL